MRNFEVNNLNKPKKLQLRLLGTPLIVLEDVPLTDIKSAKAQGLLYYLAVTGQSHARLGMATLLWGDLSESAARGNLRKALQPLRKHLGDFLIIERSSIRLDKETAPWVDVVEFDRFLQTTTLDSLQQAIDLYQGDFLDGFYLKNAPDFENWWLSKRANLREKMLDALQALADQHAQAGSLDHAIILTRRYLELEPWRESAHRRLMDLLARNGQRSAALAQFKICREILAEELGVTPARDTINLYEQIFLEDVPVPQKLPSPKQPHFPAYPRHNLPIPPTPLVGRETELDDLDCYIADPQVRLITVVAPGGMGKTRLALACAERQLKIIDERFPDGIFFIPFAQLDDYERVVDVIAEIIHFQVENNLLNRLTPEAQLMAYLREKRMFLLIDSFEHLLARVTLLSDILQISPGIQILVTSRERLHLRFEQVYTIEGLSLENKNAPGETTESPAIQLFIQSASRIKPGFLPANQEDLSYLTQICRLVDGMPLALELAAGWVDLHSLSDIALEIQRDLDFLETVFYDIPTRHHGIRAVFDSTWQQLSKNERDALARFSVFRNGCNKDAAQVVTGVSLKTLTRLFEKSLLQYDKAVDRYLIHPLLLQFAAEMISQSPKSEQTTREAHSEYYCIALEKWDKALKSPQHSKALAEMRADYENIHLAWDWALEHDHLADLLLAIEGLGEYLEINLMVFEARRLFGDTRERLQARYGDIPTSALASQLLALVMARQEIAGLRYYHPITEINLRKSLALLEDPPLRITDTRREQAFVHLRLGMALFNSADNVRAQKSRRHIETSLRLYRTLGNLVGIGEALNLLVDCAIFQGDDPDQIGVLISESLTIHKKVGDPRRLSEALMRSGDFQRLHLLDYDKALEEFKSAYIISEHGENLIGMHDAQVKIGYMNWFLGEYEQAFAAFKKALDLALRAGNQYQVVIDKFHIGLTQTYRGQFSQAEYLMLETEKSDVSYDPVIRIYLLFTKIHLGRYEDVHSHAIDLIEGGPNVIRPWAFRLLSWEALVRGDFDEALGYAQQSVEAVKEILVPTREWTAWSLAPLGLAFHRQGEVAKAKYTLFEALQTCIEIRAFIPLMHLLPVITVVLAREDDNNSQEMAVEIYAAARQIPFIGNSQLFKAISEPSIREAAMQLPQENFQAAELRGKSLKSWEIAETLLKELELFGWNKMIDA